jgi:hypothetical protein
MGADIATEMLYALADGEGFETALRSVTTALAAELILETVSSRMNEGVIAEETKDD